VQSGSQETVDNVGERLGVSPEKIEQAEGKPSGIAGVLAQGRLDRERRAKKTRHCGQAAAMLMDSPPGRE
jgi:hypothetical protein